MLTQIMGLDAVGLEREQTMAGLAFYRFRGNESLVVRWAAGREANRAGIVNRLYPAICRGPSAEGKLRIVTYA
jgi:hypothetical protein